jgi:hypothetical protein
MTTTGTLVDHESLGTQGNPPALASWYLQGASDGLGDRLLMFDNTRAPAWELLRFKPQFAATAAFEHALRDRVTRLRGFNHPSFPAVRTVDGFGSNDGVALVSTFVPGKPLSEAIARPRSAAFVMWVIQQLTPAMAALHEQGGEVAHGLLTLDRIVVTPDGRCMIREHVLGSALACLGLTADRLWTEFGIVVAPSGADAQLDNRADVLQLALIGLSLMAGRRIQRDEYPERVNVLLDEIAKREGGQVSPLFAPLRRWLESAFQLNDQPFASACDARDGLNAWPGPPQFPSDHQRLVAAMSTHGPKTTVHGDGHQPGAVHQSEIGALLVPDAPLATVRLPAWDGVEGTLRSTRERRSDVGLELSRRVERLGATSHDTGRVPAFLRPFDDRPTRRRRWITGAVAGIAIGEAVLIAGLLYGRPASPPRADLDIPLDGRIAGVTPLALRVGSDARAIGVSGHESAPTSAYEQNLRSTSIDPRRPSASAETSAPPLRASRESRRSGSITLRSPIELEVFEGERLLGHAGQPIIAAAGRHELDLVNRALGYRARQVVDIAAGQVVSLLMVPSTGRVSANASPWAEVWIDGHSVGETPLANLEVPIGEHEIVFRHPQLGEQRKNALVRTDTVTRVSVDFRK